MLVIGLCGGSGSGKSALSTIAAIHGILHLDTDRIYRELTEFKSPCLDALANEFGKDIITADGTLDRRKLSEIVFSDAKKRVQLNKISHKHILDRTRQLIKAAEHKGYIAVIVDAPLLFESEFDRECDFTIAVVADEKKRISRIIERDGIDAVAAKKRISAQISDTELKSLTDYVIVNNGTLSELEEQFSSIVLDIKNRKGD